MNNENSENNTLNTTIIVVSLFFSIISCSNKYIAIDGKLSDSHDGIFGASTNIGALSLLFNSNFLSNFVFNSDFISSICFCI